MALLVCGSGLKQVDGECVGVNDGSQSFDPGLDWITDRIHRMNTAVEDRAAEDDVEAFRIVLMGSFSLSGEADLDEEQILHAVEGAYVGIMRQNGFVETDSGIEAATEHSRIFQLYLANEGAIQQGADTVVDTLASMIDDDIPLSIVIGQSTSTTVTEQTARDLSELNIPMIAGSSTSTSINHVNSPGLIRAAPDNEDFAAALRHHLDRRVEDGHEPVQACCSPTKTTMTCFRRIWPTSSAGTSGPTWSVTCSRSRAAPAPGTPRSTSITSSTRFVPIPRQPECSRGTVLRPGDLPACAGVARLPDRRR